MTAFLGFVAVLAGWHGSLWQRQRALRRKSCSRSFERPAGQFDPAAVRADAALEAAAGDAADADADGRDRSGGCSS